MQPLLSVIEKNASIYHPGVTTAITGLKQICAVIENYNSKNYVLISVKYIYSCVFIF